MIEEARKVGWTKFKKKKPAITDLDVKGVFKLGTSFSKLKAAFQF